MKYLESFQEPRRETQQCASLCSSLSRSVLCLRLLRVAKKQDTMFLVVRELIPMMTSRGDVSYIYTRYESWWWDGESRRGLGGMTVQNRGF